VTTFADLKLSEKTLHALERAGFETEAVTTTEFRKADGSLTCLSILI